MNKDNYMNALDRMDEAMEEFFGGNVKDASEKSTPWVKATEADVIVERMGKDKKPYFEIKYKEVGKSYYNIGFGSYSLKNVFQWLDECFEIVKEGDGEQPKGNSI